MQRIFLFLFMLGLQWGFAQEYFPKNDGVKSPNNNYIAFVNSDIHTTPGTLIENGTLLIRNERIVAVGKKLSIPEHAVVIDLKGKDIYPSFIDVYTDFGIEVPKPASRNFFSRPQYDSERTGFYWNDHVMPETDALNLFEYDKKSADELRKLGFGTVNTHKADGIVRGNGILVALSDDTGNSKRVIDSRSAQYLSFKRSKEKKQVYPNSLMGSIALLEQLYLDADWYAKGLSKTKDFSLEAFIKNQPLVQIFEAGNKGNDLRAARIAKEYGLRYVILGGGDEYELADEIKKTSAAYVIPLNFPKPYDVENPYFSDYVSLHDMKKWNQAPSNPAVLSQKGVPFALTTYNLKAKKDFKNNLQRAIAYGFDTQKALEALTTFPAALLKKSDVLGTLEKGKYANFLITSGPVFDKETLLYENWVLGKKHVINNMEQIDLAKEYDLQIQNRRYTLKITGKPSKPGVSVLKDSTKLKSKITYKDNWVTILFNDNGEFYRLTGKVKDPAHLSGKALLADGKKATWQATLKDKSEMKDSKKKEAETPELLPVSFPNTAYGFTEKPKQEDVLFKNATVWTNEKDGILKNTDVLVKNGKIARIGQNINPGNAKVIDATGKHLTSGIIDEHTHITALTTNEVGQNSTAEVNMENAIDFEDINIYRSLAGGVTEAHILHGSANPIGGRSALIKLKWGELPENLIDRHAPKTIKFALGENVKQSRYPYGTNRFPQTRMGVEQVYMDYFQRAKEYQAKKKSGKPYRKDIEMETLVEILEGKRFITCHSYVQSEINMLMKVADKFGFTVNTFTHVLEGYKVADKMKAHGAGGSTFSDWWAYKYEVKDAIPYNAAILNSMGIVTAINSDDAEMIRRLNQEAAKAVKYGDVPEEDAWKMVTLNPAKLLHIDDRVGSIKVGKDADLVLWTDNPLSIKAQPVKTMIEGVVYFDAESDKLLRKKIRQERSVLIKQMLEAKNKGLKTQKPEKKENHILQCNTVEFQNM